MKIILLISFLFSIIGCSNINNVTKNPPLVNLVTNKDKYSLIFKHQFYSNYKTNDEELISENLRLEYTGTGYMFDNCLTILFEYKSSGGVADRDILPEDSVYLTFSFRNLGNLN